MWAMLMEVEKWVKKLLQQQHTLTHSHTITMDQIENDKNMCKFFTGHSHLMFGMSLSSSQLTLSSPSSFLFFFFLSMLFVFSLSYSTGGVYMGMCSFPVAATLFGLAAFQILPGVIITDQCVDFDSMVSYQLSQFVITKNATHPWLNLTTDTSMGDTFSYLSSCKGDRPELFNTLADPGPVLDRNNVNFTEDEETIRKSLRQYNYTIDFKSNVWNTIYQLEADQNLVV